MALTITICHHSASLVMIIGSSGHIFLSHHHSHDGFYYCKFGNFREGFIFANFVKIKPSRNGENTLPFIGVGKSGHSCEF